MELSRQEDALPEDHKDNTQQNRIFFSNSVTRSDEDVMHY